ncbi:MAG: hypothetical protein PF436_11880 [Prolixibacteraceae bacterium]|jgi:hypothetical protein|nr:hypothetical protein [Prolixibacteraceae bacterium]
MITKIEKLFSEGDTYLKEAKGMFYAQDEKQGPATCNCCEAIKRYLDAYEIALFNQLEPSQNYHVVLHTIAQKDPDFKQFTEKVYEVKCFKEESKKDPESFFLYDDEIDDVLKDVLRVRNYIAQKVDLGKEFMEEFSENSFMAI